MVSFIVNFDLFRKIRNKIFLVRLLYFVYTLLRLVYDRSVIKKYYEPRCKIY